MRRVAAVAVAVTVAVVLPACSQEPPAVEQSAAVQEAVAEPEDPPQDEAPPAEAAAPVEAAQAEPVEAAQAEPDGGLDLDDAARRYFEAFATDRADGMAPMLDAAAEGSPAAVYAQVQIAYAAALEQEGWPRDPSSLSVIDGGVELCSDDGMGVTACTRFEALQLEGSHLVSFAVDGVDITGRLASAAPPVEQGGTSVALLGAYHSVQSDSLIVALDVSNGGDELVHLNAYTAEYLTSAGRQVTAADALSPMDLRAGASAYAMLIFPAQGVGGTVYLTGYGPDFLEDFEWEFPLVALDEG